MAFVEGYEYDIFVSYAAVDDGDAGWVTTFVEKLTNVLGSRLGGLDRFAIFFDRRNLSANHQIDPEILGAIDRSALFLAVTSTAYAVRDYPLKEFAQFMRQDPDLKRLFAVEYLPLDEDETFPATLQTHKRMSFWRRNETTSTAAKPLPTNSETFIERIHDVADAIKRQLKTIRDEAPPPAAKGTVYLAETTDDLVDEREDVRRFLEQKGYRTLPDKHFPDDGPGFTAAAAEAIARADLYVHLLGPWRGRPRADLPDGYGHAQVAAARRSGKPMLLWRNRELTVDAVADLVHRTLLSDANVMAGGLNDLNNEIVRRLTEPPPPPPTASRPKSYVFINHDVLDRPIAEIARKEFATRKAFVGVPILQGKSQALQEDLESHLRDCDVLVLINAQATIDWVRRALLRLHRVREGPLPRQISVFRGPPQEAETDIGVDMPDLSVKLVDGWTPENISRVVAEISV
ncbi:MAG: toll/interleukin-1 receptor domain-containing protein [Rhizobiaceae bacterium]|nr:toll/interleukin-1 receptor domain-containing protein [Rhizobiaceae bacterium]